MEERQGTGGERMARSHAHAQHNTTGSVFLLGLDLGLLTPSLCLMRLLQMAQARVHKKRDHHPWSTHTHTEALLFFGVKARTREPHIVNFGGR